MDERPGKFAATVLCVDDEEHILEILRTRISKITDRVLTTVSPNRALEIVQEEAIDLVVLDLKMPGMDGISLFKEIKTVLPKIEGIFLTGFGEKKTVQEAIRLGAYDFIDKPFVDSALMNTLRHGLERVEYEKVIDELVKVFFLQNTGVDFSNFKQVPFYEKQKLIRAALGVVEVREARRGLK